VILNRKSQRVNVRNAATTFTRNKVEGSVRLHNQTDHSKPKGGQVTSYKENLEYEEQLKADIAQGKYNNFECLECEQVIKLDPTTDFWIAWQEDAYGEKKSGFVCDICRPLEDKEKTGDKKNKDGGRNSP